MEQMLYRIGEAATLLGLHDKNSNTLRSWVEEFKDFLGASANPDAGRPRFFTEDDLRVLRTVRDLRANHLPYNEIRARLSQGAHAVERPPAPAPPTEAQGERIPTKDNALVPSDQFQGLLAPMARAAEEWRTLAEQYRTRLEDREARVSSLEQRLDGLQLRLEELYATSIAQQHAAPAPPAARMPRKRRWLWGL
jgi:DNA-binding transcriptional MerR regulator